MIRLCECGFGTDDALWMACHLIEYGHRERETAAALAGPDGEAGDGD